MVNSCAMCGCCTRTDIVREHLEDTLRICDVSAKGLYRYKKIAKTGSAGYILRVIMANACSQQFKNNVVIHHYWLFSSLFYRNRGLRSKISNELKVYRLLIRRFSSSIQTGNTVTGQVEI